MKHMVMISFPVVSRPSAEAHSDDLTPLSVAAHGDDLSCSQMVFPCSVRDKVRDDSLMETLRFALKVPPNHKQRHLSHTESSPRDTPPPLLSIRYIFNREHFTEMPACLLRILAAESFWKNPWWGGGCSRRRTACHQPTERSLPCMSLVLCSI